MPGCIESIEAALDVRKNITQPRRLFRVYGYLDVGFHIRVQVQDDFVFTRVAEGAFTHNNLGFLEIRPRGGYRISDTWPVKP